jgi:hypothetical protein
VGQVVSLIRGIIELGMVIAVVGGLGEATVAAFKEAKQAHRTGLINLGKLNRTLGVGGR